MKGKVSSHIVSWIGLFGLLAIFVGERLLNGSSRWGATGVGLSLLVAAFYLRVLRAKNADPDRRSVERLLLLLQVIGAVAVALAFATSKIPVLGALFPAVLLAAALPTLFLELSYAPMALAPRLETRRIKEALWNGLSLAALVIFAFAAYYVVSERDQKLDLSYFRAAKPGQATVQVTRALNEAVTVTTFFPPANEVAEAVHEYVGSVQAASPLLHLERLDVAVDPQKARELGVSQNGTVVISRGAQKESLSLGTDLERARSGLRMLDADFQKRLLSVSRGKRVVYFTEGHGEQSGKDPRSTFQLFRKLLGSQNLEVRNLGAAEGLASQIPEGAAAVFVMGPKHALLPEEASSLERYLKAGGRVMYALDPLLDLDPSPLLSPLGLKFLPTVLANDQVFVAVTRRESDRTALATATFSSHPSVTTLSQLGRRAPLVLFEAGALEPLAANKEVSVDVTVRSHGKTFGDVNGNFTFESPPELRREWPLAAAVKMRAPEKKPEGRAVVVADSDLLSDAILPNEGNTYFALDSAKWLLGDEALAGTVVSEEDKPIQHTQKQNVAWFYSTLFLAPALVLGFGAWRVRRKR